MVFKNLLTIPMLILFITACGGNEYVKIASCVDGDTCTTTKGEKIRLACVNTPELRRSEDPVVARLARDYLRKLIVGEKLRIVRHDEDRYGRTVAELYRGDLNVGLNLVNEGFAVVVPEYAYQCDWT